jgi:hypothetical protein
MLLSCFCWHEFWEPWRESMLVFFPPHRNRMHCICLSFYLLLIPKSIRSIQSYSSTWLYAKETGSSLMPHASPILISGGNGRHHQLVFDFIIIIIIISFVWLRLNFLYFFPYKIIIKKNQTHIYYLTKVIPRTCPLNLNGTELGIDHANKYN